jgi:hypothetical protein
MLPPTGVLITSLLAWNKSGLGVPLRPAGFSEPSVYSTANAPSSHALRLAPSTVSFNSCHALRSSGNGLARSLNFMFRLMPLWNSQSATLFSVSL